jgi:hypothetical protein
MRRNPVMPIPNDHGYVVLTREDDGTISVMVCSDLINGTPSNPYAVHPHRASVSIDKTVSLATSGRTRYTTQTVTVIVAPDGTVQVTKPATSTGFLSTIRSSTSLSPS